MLSVKAREQQDSIFEVIGMTQLRIKSSLPYFAGERSNHKAATAKLTDDFILNTLLLDRKYEHLCISTFSLEKNLLIQPTCTIYA